MKKKVVLIMLLTLAINLVSSSVSFAGEVDFPWSVQPPMETTMTEIVYTP